jgi:DNA-binding MarR family transcriptional regulator
VLPPVYSTDATAWFQASALLCGLDHGERHAVLHAPGRIGAFELDQEARAAVRDDTPERHERRAADALQDGRIDPLVCRQTCRPCTSRHLENTLHASTSYVTTYTVANRRQGSGKRLVADARAVVQACAGMNIRMAERRITRFLEARMHATGLSIAQFGLMAHIAAAGDDTIGALAERAGLDQSTLSRNLRSLEQAGFVEITLVETDLRRRAVWLTEKGARRLEAAIPAWRRAHEALAEIVEPSDVQRIAAASRALRDMVQA